MKRRRRMTVASGLPGDACRRCARLLRRLSERGELYLCESHEIRDVRRLADAGLIVAAVSKGGWFGRREIAVYRSLAEARRRYPWSILPQKRRPAK